MSNLIIADDNLFFDSAYALSASSEVAMVPSFHLRVPDPAFPWYTEDLNGSSGRYCILDLADPSDLSAIYFAIKGHNLTTAATITLDSSLVSDFASIVATSGAFSIAQDQLSDLAVPYQRLLKTFDLGEAQYVRFTFKDSANPDNQFRINQLGFGFYTQFDSNFAVNWTEAFEDPTIKRRSIKGPMHTR